MLLKARGNYQPHPQGAYNARCVDVVDLGKVETQFGVKPMLKLVFITDCDEPREDGKSWLVSRRFAATIHKKSSLGGFLTTWRGRPFTRDEVNGFDPENLVGLPAYISVSHKEKDGETYDSLDSAMRIPNGAKAPAVPKDYVRWQDRDPVEQAKRKAEAEAARINGHDEPPLPEEPPEDGGDDDTPF
jgi:hypothetical protein